ncbi:MAG: DUF3536 domain-containing protein [Spirochaetes bacterium]|nr:DUF3536 domain-containing protein [Spirochaetota bacterium]
MHNFQVNTIIHGHFYQPPREDPWTDQIGTQSSAYPFKNWNIRITSECYAPNCFSRVLNSKGKIIDIINNYRYISFNFGPTLLNWLEKKDKEIYDLIIEADKLSIPEHNGHGNAIAQIYNHVIMPLQSTKDKITQIIWGLKDFKYRFGRDSEGIWLSETAIDYETVNLLIDQGIKFVILSPDQAKSFKKIHEDKWNDVTAHHHLPAKRPYKIYTEHGEITAFYFDKRLSTAVSFEHLLQSSDNFARSIMHTASHDKDIIVIAADGEIYGHHEPFADMCLAHLIKEYHLNQKKIRLLNFAEYLEMHPAEYETKLNLGDDDLGSSWSCYHGVGRWYKNCGCQTGGKESWNQEWRKPLRDAFDYLKKEIDVIYENEISNYVDDPWALRNDYIELILSNYKLSDMDFLRKHINKTLNKEEIIRILSLLESQKNAMFMYTSCGWFFTELSGIETVQNIKYAYKAIYLLKNNIDWIKTNFENMLEKAESNIKEINNGKWILYNWVYPNVQNLPHIANNIITLFILNKDINIKNFEIFEAYGFENLNIQHSIDNNKNIYEGTIKVFNKQGYVNREYLFIFIKNGCFNFTSYLVNKDDFELLNKIKNDIIENRTDDNYYKEKNAEIYTEKDLIEEIKNYIVKLNFKDKFSEIISYTQKLFNDIKNILDFYLKNNLNLPDIYKTQVSFIAESYFYDICNTTVDFPEKQTYKTLIEIFDFINHFGITVNTKELSNLFSLILNDKLLQTENNDFEADIYKKALILIEFSYKVKMKIEKSRSENKIFKLLKIQAPKLIEKLETEQNEQTKMHYLMQFRNLILISDLFNIDTEEEKRSFFKHFKMLNNLSSIDISKKI